MLVDTSMDNCSLRSLRGAAVLVFLAAIASPTASAQAAARTGVYPTQSGGPYVATLQLFRHATAPLGGGRRDPAEGWFRLNGAAWGSITQGYLHATVIPHEPSTCGLVPDDTIKYPIRIELRDSWSSANVFPATARDKIHIETRVVLKPHADATGDATPKIWPYPTTLDVISPTGPLEREIVLEATSNFEWVDQDVTLEIHVWLERTLTDGDTWAGPSNRFVYRLPVPMRAIKSKFSRVSPYLLPIAIIGDPPGNQSFSQHSVTSGLGAGLAIFEGNSSSVATQESYGFGPLSYEGPTYTTSRSTQRGIHQQVNHQNVKSIATNAPYGPGAGDLLVALLRPTLGVFRGRKDMDFRFMCGPGLPCWQVPSDCRSRIPPDSRIDTRPPHLVYFPMRDLQEASLATTGPQARLSPSERAALRSLNPLLGNPHAVLNEPRYYLIDSFSGNAGQVSGERSVLQVTGSQVQNAIANSTTRDQSSSYTVPFGAIASAAGLPLPLPDLTARTQETTTTTTEYRTLKDLTRTNGVLLSYKVADTDPNRQLCVEVYYDTMFNTFAFRDCNSPPIAVRLGTLQGQLRLATVAQARWQSTPGERADAFIVTGSLGTAVPTTSGIARFVPLDAGRPSYAATYAANTRNIVVPNMRPGRYRADLPTTVLFVTVDAIGNVTTSSQPRIAATPEVTGLSPTVTARPALQSTPPPQTLSGAIVIDASGKCLDVAGGSNADQARVQQFACHGGPNQSWNLQPLSNGMHRIVNQASRKCLDIAGGSNADGAIAQQFTCHEGPNQQWQLRAVSSTAHQLVNQASGKCLEIVGGAPVDQAPAQQLSCTAGAFQRFRLPTPTTLR